MEGMFNTPNGNIHVSRSGSLFIFENPTTQCTLSINTSNPMEYIIMNFSCGTRGGGNGAALLYYSLMHIKNNTLPRNMPFRLYLIAVPSAIQDNANDTDRLVRYYSTLGFERDESIRGEPAMFGFYDNILANLKRRVEPGLGVGKRTRRSKTVRKNKKYGMKSHKRRRRG